MKSVNKMYNVLLRRVTRLSLLVLLLAMLSSIPAGAQSLAYVTLRGINAVYVYDTETNREVARLAVGERPTGIASTPDGAFVYVACEYFVWVIDTADNSTVTTIGTESPFNHGVAVTPDGASVYVTTRNNVTVIDTETNRVVARIPMFTGSPNQGGWVAVTPDGASALVTGNEVVHVIDTASNTESDEFVVSPNIPFQIAFTPNGEFAYIAMQEPTSSSVWVLDTTSYHTDIIWLGEGEIHATGVAISPDGAFAYVTNQVRNGTVWVIDTSTYTVGTVLVDDWPLGIALTPDGAFAYVANRSSDTISVINTERRRVVATIGAVSPYAIAIVTRQEMK